MGWLSLKQRIVEASRYFEGMPHVLVKLVYYSSGSCGVIACSTELLTDLLIVPSSFPIANFNVLQNAFFDMFSGEVVLSDEKNRNLWRLIIKLAQVS